MSSQSQIIFDIKVIPYWPKWQTKCSKLAAKDFETSEFHQDMWNRYLMLGFVSADIAGNAISNLELQRSYTALCHDLVLPSTTTLSNRCHREYALTVDAIRMQLASQYEVSLALGGWTSKNKLGIMSVMGYYMIQNWALREVHLTFDHVDRLFSSAHKC